MHIEINDNTSLREIQKVFSDFYPYLKIDFFRKSHKKFEASAEKDWIEPHTTVGNIKKTHVSGLLEIRPLNRVYEVEKEFLQHFGISVQILRREKKGWEQTAGLDNLTLKELNEWGRNSSDEYILSEPDSEYNDGE